MMSGESKRTILTQQKLQQHGQSIENAVFHAALNLGDGGGDSQMRLIRVP